MAGSLNGIGSDAPGRGSFPLTGLLSDTDELPAYCRSLRCDAAGTVKFTGIDGTIDTWTVLAGDIIPVAMIRVWSTGTSVAAAALHGIT